MPEQIPARKGVAVRLSAGQGLRVINTHGHQVVDTWSFALDPAADQETPLDEPMSMEHSRTAVRRSILRVGDSYLTWRRRPILTVVSDTSPGIHDTLVAACDQTRYAQLGHEGPHDNCADNLVAALAALGFVTGRTPSPLNLFMNIPIAEGGALDWCEPVSRPGDAITFKAEIDQVAVFSACPMDLVPINGPGPTEAHFEVLDSL